MNELSSTLTLLEDLNDETKDLSNVIENFDKEKITAFDEKLVDLQLQLAEQRSKHILDLSDEHNLERLRPIAESFMNAFIASDENTLNTMLKDRYQIQNGLILDSQLNGNSLADLTQNQSLTFALNGYGSNQTENYFHFHYIVFIKETGGIYFVNFTLNSYEQPPMIDNLSFDI
jgi:hypothetical protein